MRTENLHYHLPGELIAQQPPRIRSGSRLLVLDRSSDKLTDSRFSRLCEFLLPGDCLVLNDTRVLQARFFAQRSSGAKLEGLFLTESTAGIWDAMLKGARKVRIGEHIRLKDREKADFCRAEVLQRIPDGRCRLKIQAQADAETILNEIGFPPLPPYIKRDDDPAVAAVDRLRYQTVYARRGGAVAAPTAGLHFTKKLIEQLKRAGIHFAHVTLHVGPGTFKPITTENLQQHKIHQEWFNIDEENVRLINATQNRGGRVVAVGTTSTRVLETAAIHSMVKAASGTTDLFIKPGYRFRIVDAMITNFHLPRSTLLALVAAFAGLQSILAAYDHAIKQRYRFYSYGDAMLIT
jgi:S-adenosylmethionine:tRNA ribosyltransferase-isomerase